MICLLRKLLKSFYVTLISCSNIVTKVQISILKHTHENSKLPSYIYFLLPAELIGMSAYAQFIQTYFQMHSVFSNEADLQLITEPSGCFLHLQTFFFCYYICGGSFGTSC